MLRVCECHNLSFSYGRELVLDGVDLVINEGDFLAIIGPNGGGKTTFIKLILGILKPSSGGLSLHNGIKIGYVPQDTLLNHYFPIRAIDVVQMGFSRPRFFGFCISKEERNKVFETMERLSIQDIAYRKISDLSGGQRQKVLIARAICADPQLLIFDEPTSNVDLKSQDGIYEILKELKGKHTIVVISHDVSMLLGYASRVLFINSTAIEHKIPEIDISNNGHICAVELMDELAKRMKNV